MKHSMLVLAAAMGLLACASVPGTHASYQVASVQSVGPLLDARLEWTWGAAPFSSDRFISLLFPVGDDCRALLVRGTIVEYHPGGLTGSIRLDGRSCDAVGISDLREWRDRKPRDPRSRRLLGGTRQQATYRIVSEQDDFAIVRGRFPLANWIGWVGGEDTLALIPKSSDVCTRVLSRTVASIEYLPAGAGVLVLIDNGQCRIRGFSRVVPELSDS